MVVIARKGWIALMVKVQIAGATRIRRDSVQLSFALPQTVERPWITGHESYALRWIAHRFDAGTLADLENPGRLLGLPSPVSTC